MSTQHSTRAAPPRPSTSTTAAAAAASSVPSQKPRQLSHLQSQLAQLTANMADLESLVRMSAGQARDVRGLGGYVGGMFMAASKVLGEETVRGGKEDGIGKDEARDGEK